MSEITREQALLRDAARLLLDCADREELDDDGDALLGEILEYLEQQGVTRSGEKEGVFRGIPYTAFVREWKGVDYA